MATKTKWLTDRYKSTTKIIPKITMASLTPEVKEYIESQGGSSIPLIELTNEQVVLNPTRYLFTEEQYNIIEANKVIAIKYSNTITTYLVFTGTTYPTYISTLRPYDDNIIRAISFKIDKTTYVGTQILSPIEGKKYQHFYKVLDESNQTFFFNIITDNATPLNKDGVATYLDTNNFDINLNYYPCSGQANGQDIMGIWYDGYFHVVDFSKTNYIIYGTTFTCYATVAL